MLWETTRVGKVANAVGSWCMRWTVGADVKQTDARCMCVCVCVYVCEREMRTMRLQTEARADRRRSC